MTPLESVFMLELNGVIDRKTMNEVHVHVRTYLDERGYPLNLISLIFRIAHHRAIRWYMP